MSNKKLALVLLSISAVLVVGFVTYKMTSENEDPAITVKEQSSTDAKADQKTSETPKSTKTATAGEVKKHNTKTDCWTIISGNVYDITAYVPRHPGGDEILRACGGDGTKLFTTRTTDEGESVGSGTSHSGSAESQLEQFLVGALKD